VSLLANTNGTTTTHDNTFQNQLLIYHDDPSIITTIIPHDNDRDDGDE